MNALFWLMAIAFAAVIAVGVREAVSRYAKLNKDYRAAKIIADLKGGEISDADIDEALRVSRILDDLKKVRPKIKDLAWLNEERLRRVAAFHNWYTRGPQVPVDHFLDALHSVVGLLPPQQRQALAAAKGAGELIRRMINGR